MSFQALFRQNKLVFLDFSDMSAVWGQLGGRAEAAPSGTEPRLGHSQTVFLKHFQTKEKQKWQPYFYKAGRHILQTPNFLGARACCRRQGVAWGGGERKRPREPRQRCVCRVKGTDDCLRRIPGLNSPASPALKKTDTSYKPPCPAKTERKRTSWTYYADLEKKKKIPPQWEGSKFTDTGAPHLPANGLAKCHY